MSNTQIVSKRLNVTSALEFVDDVRSNSAYYVFAAKHTPYASGDSFIPVPNDTVVNNYINIYNDMLFGKRVSNTDVLPMVVRDDWASGTRYAMYDDVDPLLQTKQFYVAVDTGSQHNVYKCLFNGGNVPSTVEPTGTDNNAYESLVDGYVWKYMYTANGVNMSKFATTQYMPVTPNTSITAAATPGSIEVIVVEDRGAGYNNYLSSAFELPTDLRLNSGLAYGIGSAASPIANFYNNCIMLITSGAAEDEYRVITNYSIVGSQKIVTIDEPFDGTIDVNDTFEIFPFVDIYDTGASKQTNCIARAIVSPSSGNSISKIEILNPGSGYRLATAVINPAAAVGVTANASLRAIMSPPDGHGANTYSELGANYAGIAVKFVENEGIAPELRTENDFRQVGLLRNPLFANVEIAFSSGNTVGTFVDNEQVLQYNPIQLTGTVNTYSNTTVTGNGTLFQNNLAPNDRILITTGTTNVLGRVVTIANNTSMTLSVNASFSSNTCNISYVRASTYGIVTSTATGTIYVANVNVSNTVSSLRFVGEESFCTTIADTIKINRGGASTTDVRNTNNFVTFSQLTKLTGTLDEGSFTTDEFVVQPSSSSLTVPSARLYTSVNESGTDILYVTNVRNQWQTGANGTSTGNSSSARFTVSNKYDGELVPGSGEIVYIENLAPVARSNTQTETIKLILEL